MPRISTQYSAGSRWYVDRETGTCVPGVTSIIDMAPNKGLMYWAAKMAAERAVNERDAWLPLARINPTGAVNYIKSAPTEYTKARAGVGSDAHDLFERLIRGEAVADPGGELSVYYRHFSEFLATVQPELIVAEDIAWSETHQYAGSFDALLRIDEDGEPVTVMADWKTSKSAYPTVALQLAAYAHADFLINGETGERSPLPDVQAGAVLHITPERWEFRPVCIDQEVFEIFLALRQVFRWERVVSRGVLGVPVARGGKSVTGTERRAG